VTSAAFAVLAARGVPASIIAAAGNGQTAAAGQPVATAPAVRVTDAFGNPVAGVAVTFAVASGGGSVAGAEQTTGTAGEAMVGSWTLGHSVGPNTLRASAAGLAGVSVTFSATAVAPARSAVVEVRNNYFRSMQNGSGVEDGFMLRPAVDTVAVGGTVSWVWVGQNHNVTPYGDRTFDASGTHDAPHTFAVTFTTKGKYHYRCTNHYWMAGMAGEVVVR
jgi:adhesin/invasin